MGRELSEWGLVGQGRVTRLSLVVARGRWACQRNRGLRAEEETSEETSQ